MGYQGEYRFFTESWKQIKTAEYGEQREMPMRSVIPEQYRMNNILELCDLVEVISAILDYRNINGKEFEEMRSKKSETNGKFKNKIFLNGVHRMS